MPGRSAPAGHHNLCTIPLLSKDSRLVKEKYFFSVGSTGDFEMTYEFFHFVKLRSLASVILGKYMYVFSQGMLI